MKHTDTWSLLSPGVAIAYAKARGANYPSQTVRTRIINSVARARSIMRAAVSKLDKVVFFRRAEGEPFTSIVNYHFGLDGSNDAELDTNVVDAPLAWNRVRHKDRRTILNKIRMGMLSISFHINTGVYLIDIDAANRTIMGGRVETDQDELDQNVVTHGYVSHPHGKTSLRKGLFSGFYNGEIHINFTKMYDGSYSAENCARVIIHEASHKYWAVNDHSYAWQGGYPENYRIADLLDNADSYAWAALSIKAGHLIKGASSRDDADAGQFPAPPAPALAVAGGP